MKLTRNEFLRIAAASVAGVGAGFPAAHAERKPNFVVILTDDQAFRVIGYNREAVKTPNLDRLATDGVIFDRAYIATPICAASRASLLTGMFPQQHGSVGLDAAGFQKHAVESQRYPTLAHALRDAGYTTAFCGKSHLGDPREYGFEAGQENPERDDVPTFLFARDFLNGYSRDSDPFLLWVATHQPHIGLEPPDEFLATYRDAPLEVDPNFMESPPEGSIYNQGLPGERYYRDSKAHNPFNHTPSGPPRSKEVMVDFLRSYYAVISNLDAQVGALIAELKRTGHYDDTIIVFLSDNGYLLGNHGLGNKITMHEESVRVPMFMHGPRLEARGVRSESLVSSLDVYPTLLELAGVPRPERLMGQSLLPLMRDGDAALREYVASECVGVDGTLGMGHRMVRTQDWKYVLTDSNDEALFDEIQDPYELTNLAMGSDDADRLALMRGYMREWMELVGDTHARPPE